MGFGYFFMIAFWALVVLGIVALVRWLMSQSGTRDGRGKTALEILQERYARGEIGRDEYEQKRKDLSS
jgi:putative membrane protein